MKNTIALATALLVCAPAYADNTVHNININQKKPSSSVLQKAKLLALSTIAASSAVACYSVNPIRQIRSGRFGNTSPHYVRATGVNQVAWLILAGILTYEQYQELKKN